MRAQLRAVEPGDWVDLNKLHHWAWFPELSEAGWAWLHAMGKGMEGWVLEDGEGVCGFLGNIRQDYTRGSQRLVAATGYSLIVLPRARGGSRLLLNTFRSQQGVFAASIFNGNARSAHIYEREGFDRFPDQWADKKIVWPLAPMTILSERIARARFRDRRPPRELFSATRGATATPWGTELVALDPRADAGSVDRFHRELCQSGALIADRSAEALHNRFSDPDRTGAPLLYGWVEGSELIAICLAQLGKMTECEAPILDVIDVAWVGPQGSRAAGSLLSRIKTVGRGLGASRMRLSLVNASTAVVARQVPGGLVRRRHVHAQSFFPGGREPAQLWDPTPYDGDFAFCLRPSPIAGDAARSSPPPRSACAGPYPSAAISSGTMTL